MPRQPPPADVLAAFGARADPEPLAGGQGVAWRVGAVVLKPGAGPAQEWLGPVLDGLTGDGFRLPAPVRPRGGGWTFRGWSATTWVDGAPASGADPASWGEVVEAGRAFHRAVADVARPDLLDQRDDAWAVADRAAWDELDVRLPPPHAALADRLRPALRPLGPAQLVHGDLTGNVLLSPTGPPAVIDVSPYWRPPAYAEGVVVADALCWHAVPAALPASAGVPVAAVARALLFRVVTSALRSPADAGAVPPDDELRRYESALTALGL